MPRNFGIMSVWRYATPGNRLLHVRLCYTLWEILEHYIAWFCHRGRELGSVDLLLTAQLDTVNQRLLRLLHPSTCREVSITRQARAASQTLSLDMLMEAPIGKKTSLSTPLQELIHTRKHKRLEKKVAVGIVRWNENTDIVEMTASEDCTCVLYHPCHGTSYLTERHIIALEAAALQSKHGAWSPRLQRRGTSIWPDVCTCSRTYSWGENRGAGRGLPSVVQCIELVLRDKLQI